MDPFPPSSLPDSHSPPTNGALLPLSLLGVRSYFSFFDSTLPAEAVASLALSLGARAVALTDVNTLAGAVVFYKSARAAGLHGVVGAELTQPLAQERDVLRRRAGHSAARARLRLPESAKEEVSAEGPLELPPWPAALVPPAASSSGRGAASRSQSPQLGLGNRDHRAFVLAMDLAGYAALSHAVSQRMMDPDFDLVTGLRAALAGGHVLVVTDCPAVLEGLLRDGRPLAVDGECAVLAAVLRGRHQRDRNRRLVQMAREAHLPLVALADACLADSSEISRHTLLQAMRRLSTVWEIPEEDKATPEQALAGGADFLQGVIRGVYGLEDHPQTPAELAGEILRETDRTLQRCRLDLPLGQWKFPRFSGVGENPSELLRELVDRGLRRRYGNPVPAAPAERARHELAVVEQLGFAEYFLLVHRIVSEAHGRGFFTVGRGSGANSILSYVLGFTEVCPLRYHLYFERFLNPERSVPPDIDIDFSWRDRDELLQWCFEFFGGERVALIATVQTLQKRQAIREVARAFGISPAEADRFTALSETGFVVEDQGRRRCLAEEEPWRSILRHARALRDFPRHFSIHCGGILITPGDVRDWVPLARAAKGFTITQMDMYSVEELGLVKIDLLSNRSLGVLRDGLQLAGKTLERSLEAGGPSALDQETPGDGNGDGPPTAGIHGPDKDRQARGMVFQREATRMKLAGSRRGTSVALAGVLDLAAGTSVAQAAVPARSLGSARLLRQRVLDFDFVTADPATRSLIDLGRTMGCFYIESPGMRALFERLRCRNFEEVVAASSIIRPGVAESGMMAEYIERHQSRSDARGAAAVGPGPGAEASERLASGLLPVNAHSKPLPVREQLGLVPLQRSHPSPPPGGEAERGQHPVAPAKSQRVPHQEASRRPPGKNGRRSSAPIHPRMLEILPETYGVMVYQEDVLRVAHEIAGMSYAEADTLRRAMSGKARSREAMLALEDKFFAGACERGLGESDAREVWRQMASFAGYSFCKGHSAAFAVLSYQVSYLKTHFPAEFTAGLINNQGGFYGPGPYLEEGRRWGLEIYPPCVQNSDEECTGQTMALDPWSTMEPFLRPPQIHEPHLDPRIPPPRPTIGWVRLGLQLISGLRRGTPARIVAERNSQGPFRDLADFLQRTAILPEETHRLIDAGALDTLLDPQRHHHPGAVRPTLHFEASRLHRALAAVPSTPDLLTPLGNPGLQGIPSGTTPGPGTLSPEKGPATPGQAPPWTVLETCQREMAVLGFMAGAHPLDFTGPLPPPRRGALPLVPARLIRLANGKTVRMIGWLIAAKILATKTTGQPMKMLTLEDRTDTFEATLFPRVYARYAPRTLTRGPYLVEGTVDMSLGSPVLTVRHLELLPLMEPDIQVE